MKGRFRLFQSVRMRIIALFLVFLVPVYLIGALIYLWGHSTIEEQTKEAQANRVSFMMEGLEAEFARIRSLQYDFFSDTYLARLADTLSIMSNYERDMSIISIENRLMTIQSSSRYIAEVTVLVPSINRKVNSKATDVLGEWDYGIIEQFRGISHPESFFQDGIYYLYGAAHVGFNPADRDLPKYCLVIEISARELANTITSLRQEGEEYIYLPSGTLDLQTSLEDRDAALDLVQKMGSEGGMAGEQPQSYRVKGEPYLIFSAHSAALDLDYVSLVSERDIFHPINSYLALFILFSVVVLTTILLFSYYVRRSIHLPLVRLLDAFRAVETGSLDTRIRHDSMDEFYYIYDGFNSMAQQLGQLIDQVYRHKMLAQKAELKQLQAQINPHFLFNSFFILKRRIRDGDTGRATEMADSLGEYFQFITRSASSSVPLSEEVRHAHIYTQIQSARFANRIQVSFEELPREFGSLMVERLILQPVIENAFEYGLEDKVRDGMLAVEFDRREDELVISVQDNGASLADEDIARLGLLLETPFEEIADDEIEVTGILNIHRRLRYKMGGAAGLRLSRGRWGGLLVELHLKLPEGGYDV